LLSLLTAPPLNSIKRQKKIGMSTALSITGSTDVQTYFLVRTLKNKAQFCDYKSQTRTGVKRMQSCKKLEKKKQHHLPPLLAVSSS